MYTEYNGLVYYINLRIYVGSHICQLWCLTNIGTPPTSGIVLSPTGQANYATGQAWSIIAFVIKIKIRWYIDLYNFCVDWYRAHTAKVFRTPAPHPYLYT